MNRSVCGVMVSVAGLAVLGMTATPAAVQTNGAMAQRRMPAVPCHRNPRAFPPRSTRRSAGPRTRIEPA